MSRHRRIGRYACPGPRADDADHWVAPNQAAQRRQLSLAFAADNMQAFPPAEEGMTRHVINLSKQEDETAFKVELIITIGKNADSSVKVTR